MMHILWMAVVGLLSAASVPLSMILIAGLGLSEAVVFTVSGRTVVFGPFFRRADVPQTAPPTTIPGTKFSFATPQPIAAAAFAITIMASGALVGQMDAKATSSSAAFSC